MTLSITQCVLNGLTFPVNPSAIKKPREILQSMFRSIDGTMQSTHIPDDDDATKIKIKRRFELTGEDPDGSVIEALEATLVDAPPLSFTNAEGETYQVLVEKWDSGQEAERWESRPWSLSLVEA